MCTRCKNYSIVQYEDSFFFPPPLDLFPVEHQTGETASSQQGGAGGGKGEESGVVQ